MAEAPGSGSDGGREFPSTSWSAVLHARDPGSPEHRRNLERLVAIYWRPVYWVIRRRWARSDDEAKDLTQEFFASAVLDGTVMQNFQPGLGSFRSYLRGALSNFMGHVVEAAARLKRGGNAVTLSLDASGRDVLEGIPDTASLSPEAAFDAAWNRFVLMRAVEGLERRLVAEGKATVFAAFRRYELEGEAQDLSYVDLGRDLGLSADQVKHGLVRARKLLRESLAEVLREYVGDPRALAEEMKATLPGTRR